MEESARRATIVDVARAAGVSKSAVSFAFNTPERLSPLTVTRIRDVADALGYRPDPVARMLAQRRTGALGILTPQPLDLTFSNPYFGAFTAGVAVAAELAGYALQLISPLHGSLARAVDRASVDGIIAVGLPTDHPEIGQIRRSGLPFVLVDSTAIPGAPTVTVDDEAGAYAAAQHVLRLGHREVLIVSVESPARSGGETAAVGARRLRGYRRAFEEATVPLPDDRIVIAATTIDGGVRAFRDAWTSGRRPTAVLAMSDATAIGTMHAARGLSIRVPDELSVVGFDDVELAQYVDPPLTTVNQPIGRKAAEAVRLLLRGTARPAGPPEHRQLEVRLVVRESTGPASAVSPPR